MLEGTRDNPALSIEAGTADCFHCGLPVPELHAPPPLDVLDSPRSFCCHGCRAVAKAIVDAGMAEYYRLRSESAASAASQAIPEFLKQVDLYDRAEIQQDFVTAGDDWREASLLLENIRCPACLWLSERQLRSLRGVIAVHIDDATRRARVRWDPEQVRLSEILRAITRIGYIAHPYDAARSEELDHMRRRRSTERLIFAGAAGMFVMNFSLATYVMGAAEVAGQLPLWEVIGRWTSLLITGLILAYPGQDFFVGAWQDLRNRRLGMDVPVVLGLSIAWLGSLHATVTAQGDVYYDSIAMFVFLLLLARRLELRGKVAAANRLDRLARIAPKTVRRIDSDGASSEVSVNDLAAGDHIRLLPGETLPVDATLLAGSSSFDESLLTGEANPVLKQPGDALVAGTVNGEQPVTAVVTRSVQTSALNEIRKLVERGLEHRPRYAMLADRVARWFVLVLLLIATLTAAVWYLYDPAHWLASTIAVLIVTCPCALALATPVALAVSAGRFVDLGILPLHMHALDALVRADVFAFDKTGTLTHGKPAVADVIPTGRLDRDRCLRVAAAMSATSEHPVARALRRPVTGVHMVAEPLENIPGAGIRCLLDGGEWRLGRPEFVTGDGELAPEISAAVDECRARGQLVSLLSGPAGVQAVFALEDPLRADAPLMLHGLRQAGVGQFALLSGDAVDPVRRLSARLGIGESLHDMKPGDKLAWLRARQSQGHTVVMVGDGINDAPTLAAADASVSFADATDLANSSSDFLILGSNITPLVAARRLARRTRRIIAQNLSWAAAYNLVAVPFAAVGWIPPWGAAIGMSLSSLVVVMNASRL